MYYFLKINFVIIFFYSISLKHRAVRVLSRRYALTTTGYKFLEIGINVGPPSYVEIAIADNRGNKLKLSIEAWKGLYEQRWNIHNLLQADVCNFITIGSLTVRPWIMDDVKLVRLESLNIRLTMTEATLVQMFNLDWCISAMFNRLCKIVETVDTKFTQFSNIASTVVDPTEVSSTICASNYFDKNQLVDCELLALVFS